MERPTIVVVGFNGNAMEMIEAVESSYRIAAFLDDAPQLQGTMFEGIPVEPFSALTRYPGAQLVMMIGSEHSVRQRSALVARLGVPAARWARVIHPAANVSRLARLGHGVVLGPGVWIGAQTRLADHVLVLQNSVVSHDVEVGEATVIAANVTVAGGCRIGKGCYLGAASSIRSDIAVGDHALIGMAANVVREVAPDTVVIGNPARVREPSGGHAAGGGG